MKVKFKISYHKDGRRRENVPIAWYDAVRKGDIVYAYIYLHPILRQYPDLRRGVLRHEKDEVTAWAKGNTAPHRYASKREPRITRKLGGKQGFWQEVSKRER